MKRFGKTYPATNRLMTSFLREEESEEFKETYNKFHVFFIEKRGTDPGLNHVFKEKIQERYPNAIMHEILSVNETKDTVKWRNHFVDVDLKDDWLERLNNLPCRLESICSGHSSDTPHQNYFGYIGGECPSFDLISRSEKNMQLFLNVKTKLNEKENTKAYIRCAVNKNGIAFNHIPEKGCKNIVLSVESTIKNKRLHSSQLERWWEETISLVERIY